MGRKPNECCGTGGAGSAWRDGAEKTKLCRENPMVCLGGVVSPFGFRQLNERVQILAGSSEGGMLDVSDGEKDAREKASGGGVSEGC